MVQGMLQSAEEWMDGVSRQRAYSKALGPEIRERIGDAASWSPLTRAACGLSGRCQRALCRLAYN
jgi:hypothetical protein